MLTKIVNVPCGCHICAGAGGCTNIISLPADDCVEGCCCEDCGNSRHSAISARIAAANASLEEKT